MTEVKKYPPGESLPFADNLSPATVAIARVDLQSMIRLVRLLDRLGRHAVYRAAVAVQVAESARFDPGHAAVMMGYDFHLTPAGPRLIEVNTNAGGILPAWLAGHPGTPLPPRLKNRLLATFAEEMQAQSRGALPQPRRIAIIDETPAQQFLYPEMQLFAELFRQWGVAATVVDPENLEASADGVFLGGERVDLVYNRHCDFTLDTPPLAGLRAAYLAGSVCLTPNPFVYALLADKRRLVQWRDATLLAACGLAATERELLMTCVPECLLLEGGDRERLWRERGDWVFKPVDRFGSRGVLVGEKMTRGRFEQLDAATTLVQRLVPPSTTEVPGFGLMKTDIRLYAYRDRVLGVTARLYRGQVTNLRTEGGGFAAVQIV
ncbi:MAG: hypothetical protein NDI73_06515 [Desulfuromonadales bacterium]|nr:hypothetical protein [Desulfuromonadales bacterium]